MTPRIPEANLLALIHSDDYANWVFDENHPTQGRRFMRAAELLRDRAPRVNVRLTETEANKFPTFEELQLAHTLEYIEQVLLDGTSGEWQGNRRDLGKTALRMAGGTMLAAEALLSGEALTAVNFAGAKHHAMADRSSGFCVFNDFAVTAHHILRSKPEITNPRTKRTRRVGRIAILDIDAHHGDGTEELTERSQRIFTFSVHDRSIFPGTGKMDNPDFHVFNRPLESGAGDAELVDAIADFVLFSERFGPDMIFIAMGADGHATDPLSTLTYSIEGLTQAVRNVRRAYPDTPILLGGAGGYQPDTITPEAWVAMALAAATPVEPDDVYWVSALGDIGYLDDPEERQAEPIDEHLARHAHLFATTAAASQEKPRFIAPPDPRGEEHWSPAKIGQIRAGDTVRVMRDAYQHEDLADIHNGRICEVIEVTGGDVICKSIDAREPVLTRSHYAPYHLEQWNEVA